MKIKITLFALLLSLISFGQEREYKNELIRNFKDKNYIGAIVIAKQILQNQYANTSQEDKIFTYGILANSYALLYNYTEAIKSYTEYLDLIKGSTIYRDDLKEKTTIFIQKRIDELQSKLQNSNSTAVKTQSTETNSESSSNKTTTLVVTGQGKTKDEAQQNALRSAIEQAFGTFISSKTELLNDELVSDEIVSLSNGNIQEFEILSELQIPNGNYSITLKATVSVSKLTSFVESKGLEVEFKGSLFGANMRQQESNKVAEFKAIINLCEASNEMLSKSLDYEVEYKEPTVAGNQPPGNPTKYEILLIVTASTNTNYQTFAEYFTKTISFISMSESEVSNYKKLNKGVYALFIGNNKLFFRNPKTSIALQNLFLKSNKYLHNFSVSSNIGIIPLEINGLKKNSFFNTGYQEKGQWVVNSQGSGVGFPNFNSPRHGYTRDEELFKRSNFSSWMLYATWINFLGEEDHKIFMDTTNYFHQLKNDYTDRLWRGGQILQEGGPSIFEDYIGILYLYPTSHLSLYKAVFSEEDLTKITGFQVKQLK
jgi:hypothetical protein